MDPNSTNPFAAPQSEVLSSDPRLSTLGGAWRDGDLLVVRDQTKLPERCVKCNTASDIRMKKRMTWHSPMLYLLILINLILYAIVAIVVQKKGRLEFSLCRAHLNQRRIAILVGFLGTAAFFAMLIAALTTDTRQQPRTADMRGLWVLAAAVVMITSLVYAVIKSQPLKPSRIENGVLWLKGAGLSFLDSIDEDFPRKLL